jgi:hypothetical protein
MTEENRQLRNLIDTSFVIQNYEMVLKWADTCINDFKGEPMKK